MSYLSFCGCYTVIRIDDPYVRYEKKYLPIVGVDSHTNILSTTARTTLTQTFQNTSDAALQEVQYTFPLYDGVTVVGFTFTVAGVTTHGVVKERDEAKAEYKAAVDRGETAGLFEQSLDAGDVFATSIGNVPANETVTVKIDYVGVLKHDAQVDGIRLTIPTAVAPRYGSSDSYSTPAKLADEPFKVTVDAEMADGSVIKSIQSPSHTLTVNIGTTSTAPDADPTFSKASATLSLNSTSLDTDFIVQVVATKLGEPSAVLETHPTIPNQRAIMASLVPKFELPAEAPELVFVCDRSGSMGGKIPDLKSALHVFLKSLPVGIKFNICSFGTRFDFLWDKSQTYSEKSLKAATQHVDTFDANYGGTEMYQPVEATFKQRYKDINLEVFLLTDGEIWDQERLFQLINDAVEKSKGAVRVFTLGIGSGASSALVEGAARAGRGFSQSVADNEKMDKKVIRMLKGALTPHINDYTLEIKYDKPEKAAYVKSESDDDDFEIVDKVGDLVIDDGASEKTVVGTARSTSPVKKVISLFNKDHKSDDTIKVDMNAVLPTIPVPKYLQTPNTIPPLFPFNRTTVYVLLSDTTPTRTPTSVILRATSDHGPLELEIPVTALDHKQETIHQLAARDAVHDLEEGRGWLTKATDSNGKLIKNKYPSRFDDLVKREAVRLGVTYQVGGKWCSFVAIQDSTDGTKAHEVGEAIQAHNDTLHGVPVLKGKAKSSWDFGAPRKAASRRMRTGAAAPPPRAAAPLRFAMAAPGSPARSPARQAAAPASRLGSSGYSPTSAGLFGSATAAPGFAPGFGGFGGGGAPPPPPPSGGLFGAAPAPPPLGGLFGSKPAFGSAAPSANAFDAAAPTIERGYESKLAPLAPPECAMDPALMAQYEKELLEAAAAPAYSPAAAADESAAVVETVVEKEVALPTDILGALIKLQTFEGNWSWGATLGRILGVSASEVGSQAAKVDAKYGGFGSIPTTAATIAYFKKKLADDHEVWELVVEKAEAWLASQTGAAAATALVTELQALF
ncbi:hypothetical protein Q8F55_004473 [Vanrija albida]|uniref:VIT domain-containing protein n=1 Tax=Vanrija albida TaxID=181172 RepID=A0ABR3Q7G9_9TREE